MCILSDHFPILLEAGSFEWVPPPFRFCNSWLDLKDCCCVIENALGTDNQHGWAGFVLSTKLRKVKSAVKAWNLNFENEKKKTEEALIKEIEISELLIENSEDDGVGRDICLSLKADLLALYCIKERNLMQKSKLNWLSLGDENSKFFHRFLSAKREGI